MWFSRKEKISYLRHDFTEKENGLLSQKHGKNMKMNIFVQLYLKCGKRPTQKWLLQLIFLKQNMFHFNANLKINEVFVNQNVP